MRRVCTSDEVMSETSAMSDYQRVIRSLELKLELLEYGLALPRDEDAISRTKALLEDVRSHVLETANVAA
jgi:hypothetical protein